MDVETIIVSMRKITAEVADGVLNENNLARVLELDPLSTDQHEEYGNQTVRQCCVIKLIELLFRVKNETNLDLSVAQCADLSKAIEFVVKFGFIPFLIPTVWNSFDNKQKIAVPFDDDMKPTKRYEALKFNVNSFFDLIKEPILKKLIMAKHTNVLLAGLCQLSLLPIAKPNSEMAVESDIDELKYEQLIEDQITFKNILKELILTDRNPLVIREMIFLLSHKTCQIHLKRGIQNLFSDLLIQPNGIQTILRVACDLSVVGTKNFCEFGAEEWSNLIHSYYMKSKVQYIRNIIPQIWELLRSKTKQHYLPFRSVAVFCIHLMSKENYNDFLAFYVHPIDLQLIQIKLGDHTHILVSQCIEDLHTMFCLFEGNVWSLNPKLLRHFATTIYNMYLATVNSVYYLKSRLEDLVVTVLMHFSDCKDHLKLIVFSPYQVDISYDGYGNMQIKFVEREHQLNLEHQADLVIDLLKKRPRTELTGTLFVTFLNMYAEQFVNEGYTVMERMFVVKCIYYLIEQPDVQSSLSTKHPDAVLNVIASLLKEISEQDDDEIDEQMLSISLMVLGCVLDNFDDSCMNQLDIFLEYLPKIVDIVHDDDFKQLLVEVQDKIRRIKSFDSWWVEEKEQKTIDDLLRDLRDPLLPCRAHALIELKKMIESGNSTVLANKSAILVVIRENLKNADSYLYLSAIFTLSALCSSCPSDILPILCEEYSMPKTYNHSPETRLKIGEVLMKTIKLLNETIPAYRNQLLNCFMAGVRDDDNLVRVSSVSNLAEVCRLLRFDLGSVLAEVLNCADYMLRFDPAIEVRRGAALLLQLIIQGAGSDALELLSGDLKDIYRMLKYQYHRNKDTVIRLHAQVALEKLNDSMMQSLRLNDGGSGGGM